MTAGRLAVVGVAIAVFGCGVLVGIGSVEPEESLSVIEIATDEAARRPDEEEGPTAGGPDTHGDGTRDGRGTRRSHGTRLGNDTRAASRDGSVSGAR